MITFKVAGSGAELGAVDTAGGVLTATTPALDDVVAAWLASGRSASEFAVHYADWSNGYVSARAGGGSL